MCLKLFCACLWNLFAHSCCLRQALEVRRSFLSMLEPAEDGIRETLLQRVWDFVCGVGLGLVSNSAAKYALDKAASVAVGVAEIVLK